MASLPKTNLARLVCLQIKPLHDRLSCSNDTQIVRMTNRCTIHPHGCAAMPCKLHRDPDATMFANNALQHAPHVNLKIRLCRSYYCIGSPFLPHMRLCAPSQSPKSPGPRPRKIHLQIKMAKADATGSKWTELERGTSPSQRITAQARIEALDQLALVRLPLACQRVYAA